MKLRTAARLASLLLIPLLAAALGLTGCASAANAPAGQDEPQPTQTDTKDTTDTADATDTTQPDATDATDATDTTQPGSSGASDAPSGQDDGDEALPNFMEVTGLDKMQQKLADGAAITEVFYWGGTMSSLDVHTQDPEEMQALWDAIRQMKIVSKSNESMTDNYPQIRFTLSDDSTFTVMFIARWLDVPRGYHSTLYNLTDDAGFWRLVAQLEAKYTGDD